MQAGFGLGRLHHVLSRGGRERIVLSALDAGFRHFDVAPAYGDGLAERELGRILDNRRDGVTITTKYGIPFRPIGELPTPVYFGLRALGQATRVSFGAKYGQRNFVSQVMVASLENSLRRLRTDHVDHFLVHDPRDISEFRALANSWPEMERQQKLGKLRRFGVACLMPVLLDAEREGLVPEALDRMVPMSELLCGMPESWFTGREVFVFNVVTHFRKAHGPGRMETRALIERFAGALPRSRPILATHDVGEIKRMGECIASLTGSGRESTGAAR
jgi:D-threo-aldose 1-dehydrogenase